MPRNFKMKMCYIKDRNKILRACRKKRQITKKEMTLGQHEASVVTSFHRYNPVILPYEQST